MVSELQTAFVREAPGKLLWKDLEAVGGDGLAVKKVLQCLEIPRSTVACLME